MNQKGIILAIVALFAILLGIVLAFNWSMETYQGPTNNPPTTDFRGPTGAPHVNGPTSNPPGYNGY